MTDHSSNINPVGSTKAAIDAIRKNANIVLEYPDYLNTKINALVHTYFGVPLRNISVAAGSTQILFDIPRLLSYKRAVVIVPTFWEYTILNERSKKRVKKIHLKEEHGFNPDYSLIQKSIKDGDAVFICNVNNPTSKLYKKDDLLKLVKDNPRIQFIVDETYLIFRKDYRKQTLSKEVQKVNNLHIVASLSKFFALPGMRLGVIISNRDTIASYIATVHVPYSIHPLSCTAFEPLLRDKEFTKESQAFYAVERKAFYKKVKEKLKGRLATLAPDGNFIFGRILTGQESSKIVRSLSKRGILIRGGDELSDVSENWIRFSIRSKKDNAALLKTLDEVLER